MKELAAVMLLRLAGQEQTVENVTAVLASVGLAPENLEALIGEAALGDVEGNVAKGRAGLKIFESMGGGSSAGGAAVATEDAGAAAAPEVVEESEEEESSAAAGGMFGGSGDDGSSSDDDSSS